MDASASRLRAVQSTARRLGLEVALTTRAGDLREYAAAAAAGTLDGEANVGTQFDKVGDNNGLCAIRMVGLPRVSAATPPKAVDLGM